MTTHQSKAEQNLQNLPNVENACNTDTFDLEEAHQ
jgi:hypothetical protein